MSYDAPTTVALATPPGTGAIGVVVVAGPGAAALLQGRFDRPLPQSEKLAHGTLVDEDGASVEEVLIDLVAPARYAVHLHGGRGGCQAMIDLFCRAGAERATEAIGFERAAGDRLQQAAVAALPQAVTRRGAEMLLAQAAGALSGAVRQAVATSDRALLDTVLATAAAGCRLLDPPCVVLTGLANAGKSSLANRLHRRERSIVTDQAGTTLDPVEELATIDDYPFWIVDTPGPVGGCAPEPEREAEAVANRHLGAADLRLHLIDLSDPRAGDEIAQAETLQRSQPLLIVLNKVDRVEAGQHPPAPEGSVLISCTDRTGLERLRRTLVEWLFPGLPDDPAGAVVFTRFQKDAIMAACAAWPGPAAKTTLLNLLGEDR